MNLWVLCIVASLAYGSLPFAVIVSRLARSTDPRSHGSGVPGVANTAMSFGWGVGAIVAVLEGSKGLLATMLPAHLGLPAAAQFICLFGAVVATGCSPWLGFRGGHARTPGIWGLLVAQPLVLLIAFAVYGAALVMRRPARWADTAALLSLGLSLGALTTPLSGLFAGGLFTVFYLWRNSVVVSDTAHYQILGRLSD